MFKIIPFIKSAVLHLFYFAVSISANAQTKPSVIADGATIYQSDRCFYYQDIFTDPDSNDHRKFIERQLDNQAFSRLLFLKRKSDLDSLYYFKSVPTRTDSFLHRNGRTILSYLPSGNLLEKTEEYKNAFPPLGFSLNSQEGDFKDFKFYNGFGPSTVRLQTQSNKIESWDTHFHGGWYQPDQSWGYLCNEVREIELADLKDKYNIYLIQKSSGSAHYKIFVSDLFSKESSDDQFEVKRTISIKIYEKKPFGEKLIFDRRLAFNSDSIEFDGLSIVESKSYRFEYMVTVSSEKYGFQIEHSKKSTKTKAPEGGIEFWL